MAFSYSRSITINAAQITGTLTNFPILVAGTYSYLATVANGGLVTNASGYDIGFYSDALLTTKLDWETESYNGTTGAVIYHVRVPSAAVGTVIYLAYGNAAITTDQSNKTGVWDTNYSMVVHGGDGTTVNVTDSTSNGLNGTNGVGAVGATASAGKVGGALTFNGSQLVNFGAVADVTTGEWTLEFWFKSTASSQGFVAANTTSGGAAGWDFLYTSAGGFMGRPVGSVSSPTMSTLSGTNDGVWRHVAMSRSVNTITFYANGVAFGSTGAISGSMTSAGPLQFAARNSTPSFIGSLDEFRFTRGIPRSAAWLAGTVNTATPASFYTVGSQIAAAGGLFGRSTLDGLSTSGTQQFTRI